MSGVLAGVIKVKNKAMSYALNFYAGALIRCCKNNRTCKNCMFWKKHKGCFFREGRTPREWENC